MADSVPRRYLFGAREELTVLGTLRPGQAAALLAGAAGGLFCLYSAPSTLGLACAAVVGCASAGFGFFPVRGRTCDQWLPVILNWVLRRNRVTAGYRSSAPTQGHRISDGQVQQPPPAVPPQLTGCRIEPVSYGRHEIGVLTEERRGTLTALFTASADTFGFLADQEQERQLEGWGRALAGFCQDGSAVRRIQWIERTLPAGGDELASYLHTERDPAVPLESDAVRSYLALLEAAAPTAQQHEVLIAVQVDRRKAGRGRQTEEDAAVSALIRETEDLAEGLSRAGLAPLGLLTPRQYARVLREGFDPFGHEPRKRLAVIDPERADADPDHPGPLAAEGIWRHYRADNAVHITHWVASWPRVPAYATFLLPLLMETHASRAVSVVMAPTPFSVAQRKAEARQTAEDADDIHRHQQGFTTTARVRRRKQEATRKDEELAAGHGEMRFSGYITTSGRTIEEAEEGSVLVERAALRSGLELQRLDGEHDAAIAFTLPLCRGLSR